MISLLISATTISVVRIQKIGVKQLINLPLNIDDGGILAVARRCKATLKEQKIRDIRINIILLENVVYKEFSHVPTTQKAAAGFAVLEARTVLREQAGSYLLNHIDYGEYRNNNNEEISLLLASPTAFMKAIQTAFLSCGFIIEGIHSLFDAYMSACKSVVVPHMGVKSFVAIDFGCEHTMVNVYCNGLLASQRRLQGFACVLSKFMVTDNDCSEDNAVLMLRNSELPQTLSESVQEAILSFIWDTLRTVRVVTAPLSINLDEFFLSGDLCESNVMRELLVKTLELPCTFASDIDCSAVNCVKHKSSMLIHAGAASSKTDLLSEIRVAKKNSMFDFGVCATLTIIVAAGLLTQPFILGLRSYTLEAVKSEQLSLAPVAQALQRSMDAATKINGIYARKEALKEYTSNAGHTMPQVADLFGSRGLAMIDLTYDGLTGTYKVNFTASSKETFLTLKDKIYANPEYFLNLNLSATEGDDGECICSLTFVPKSYKAIVDMSAKETQPQDTEKEADLLEEWANEK